MTLEQQLYIHFGHTTFRPYQKKVIESLLNCRDTLTILPTGSGKSVCYQLPAVIFHGTTLVVSPLIALMKDQVQALQKRKISAAFINSCLIPAEIQKYFTLFTQGKIKILYISPERLQSPEFIRACQKIQVPLVIIDEAHCISQWGHDFRPSYRKIAHFLAYLPKRPIVGAFSGTATVQVKKDICRQLRMVKPAQYFTNLRRPNLSIDIHYCRTRTEQELLLFRILKIHSNYAGIIYCITREKAEYLHALLTHYGYHSDFYHAGRTTEERERVQGDFQKGTLQIVVATNAFGLGIDKSDVRFVIHFNFPNCLENYVQEMGRAGRDGFAAQSHILFLKQDLDVQLDLLKNSDRALHLLKKMWSFLHSKSCRAKNIVGYFQEACYQNCGQCDMCRRFRFHDHIEKEAQKLFQTCKAKHISLPLSLARIIVFHKPKNTAELMKIGGVGKGLATKLSVFLFLMPVMKMENLTRKIDT